MKAIASVAIAGLIAATSLTTAVTPADAGGKHWKHHNQWSYKHSKKSHRHHNKHYHYHYSSKGWNPGAALATGALLGFTVGALTAPNYYVPKTYAYTPPPPPPPPAYASVNAQHVSWCSTKYRSYNVTYNTWIGFDGLVHQCISPYYHY